MRFLNRQLAVRALLSTLIVFCIACSHVNDAGQQVDRVHGVVRDEAGVALEGVQVSILNKSALTTASGEFTITDFGGTGQIAVLCSKTNYFDAIVAVERSSSSASVADVDIAMMSAAKPEIIASTKGGTINTGRGKIDFPPNIFATRDGSLYTGDVNIVSRQLDPGNPVLFKTLPGLTNSLSAGTQNSLFPFGILRVQIHGSSDIELGITAGGSADVTFELPASFTTLANPQIPMWYFDKYTHSWIQEGNAVLQGGAYVGKVSHFSDWIVAEKVNAPAACGFDSDYFVRGPGLMITWNGSRIISFPDHGPLGVYTSSGGVHLTDIGQDVHNYELQLSADGRRIMTKCNSCDAIDLWDGLNGSLVKHLTIGSGKMLLHPNGSSAIYYNPQDTVLVHLRLIDSTEIKRLSFNFSPGYIPDFKAFSSDGERILFIVQEGSHRYLKVWDIVTDDNPYVLEIVSPWQYVSCSSDLKTIAISDNGAIAFLDVATGAQLNSSQEYTFPNPTAPGRFAFGPGGSTFIGRPQQNNEVLGVYDIATGALIKALPAIPINKGPNQEDRLVASADGSIVALNYWCGSRVKVHTWKTN